MFSINLREQKKVAAAIIFSLGFFIYGVSVDDGMNGSMIVAKEISQTAQRGIASVPD